MDGKDVAEAFYVPMTSLQKAVDFVGSTERISFHTWACERNLSALQRNKCNNIQEIKHVRPATKYFYAVRRAIYSHRWDDLAYLLQKSPVWEQNPHNRDLQLYFKALVILFMYHPAAKSQSLLDEYLHMVHACHSAADKRAFYKSILSLPRKLFKKNFYD